MVGDSLSGFVFYFNTAGCQLVVVVGDKIEKGASRCDLTALELFVVVDDGLDLSASLDHLLEHVAQLHVSEHRNNNRVIIGLSYYSE